MSSKIPLQDLQRFHRVVEPELLAAAKRVVESGRFILGPEVDAFELELAEHLAAPNVVGVSSGTDALVVSLLAAALPSGAEVVTTPFSFFATVSAIVRAGLRPVFCDLAKDSFAIDASTVAAVRSENVGAVVAVHLFGIPAPVSALRALCDERGWVLVEDAAQALGARHQGQAVGTWGDFGAFSFFPSKSLGGLGDGGAICCPTAQRASRLRALRQHGSADRVTHELLGGNYRLDALQAAFLRVKLRYLAGRMQRIRALAERYHGLLGDVKELIVPRVQAPELGSYSLYTLRVLEGRSGLLQGLAEVGIEARVHYERPLHLQPALSFLGYARGDFPAAEQMCEQALAIPLYAELSEAEQLTVANAIRRHYGYAPVDAGLSDSGVQLF